MKAILVPVADRPECNAALDQAFRLADLYAGNVIGCHLRPSRSGDASAKHRGRLFGFHKWASIARNMSPIEIESNRAAAEALFGRLAAERGFELVDAPTLGAQRTAQWVLAVGSVETMFSTLGRAVDISIVSRPTPTSTGAGGDFMLAALLETGKPLLVLPQTPMQSLGRRVLIAWNQSVEAARAVTAALPLLQQAESVQIVTAGAQQRVGPNAEALAGYLQYWSIEATCRRTKGRDAAIEIVDVFRDEGSDLVVMGAFSRGRMRENVFGGLTEDILIDTELPVLAVHS